MFKIANDQSLERPPPTFTPNHAGEARHLVGEVFDKDFDAFLFQQPAHIGKRGGTKLPVVRAAYQPGLQRGQWTRILNQGGSIRPC